MADVTVPRTVTLSAPTTLPLVGDVTMMLTGPLLLALLVVVGLAPPEPQPATTNAQPMTAATIATLSLRDPDMREEFSAIISIAAIHSFLTVPDRYSTRPEVERTIIRMCTISGNWAVTE
ncbi:MAG TPA: hypothetical protein VNY31_08110 [Solirubrobacteraceae bacterium]|nr:hypothetical protein [Solirubrobacteraceae bacterium]